MGITSYSATRGQEKGYLIRLFNESSLAHIEFGANGVEFGTERGHLSARLLQLLLERLCLFHRFHTRLKNTNRINDNEK